MRLLQSRHGDDHPAQMGPDGIPGQARKYRFIHERAPEGYGGVHRRQEHRKPGFGSDKVRSAWAAAQPGQHALSIARL